MAVRDTRLKAKAIMQRWPIPEELRSAMIKSMIAIVADKTKSPRERTSAFKAILAAEKQNQEDEHKVVDIEIQRRDAELDKIAADLGITIDLVEDADRQSGGDVARIEEATGDDEEES
jgi:hypothetical protein